MHMDVGLRLIDRAYGRLLSVVGEDLYHATLNPSQAALMMYGLRRAHQRDCSLMEEIFVKKEKLLEGNMQNTGKNGSIHDIEHGTLTKITGKELDALFNEVDVLEAH